MMWEEGLKLVLRAVASFVAGGLGIYFWEVTAAVVRGVAGGFAPDWFAFHAETIMAMALAVGLVWGLAVWKRILVPACVAVCGAAALLFLGTALLRHEVGMSDNMVVRFHLLALGLTLVVSLVIVGLGVVLKEAAEGVRVLGRGN